MVRFKNTAMLLICNSLISLFLPTTVLKAQNSEPAKNWVPYLQNDGMFRYVDENLKQQINGTFNTAEKFLPTGYALVSNKDRKNAVIDSTGTIVFDFTEESITLEVVNNLTLAMVAIEYEKQMPAWKWDWNIMGGDVKKTRTFNKRKIRVLETNQLLFKQDVPYNADKHDLYASAVDENQVILNDVLFEIKNKKFKQLKSAIGHILDNGRYIPARENTFEIYALKDNKSIISNLRSTNSIELIVNKQAFVLDSINQDRYAPTVPKTFLETRNNAIYVYPQYDKVFPKEINNANTEQLNFLKDVSLIYSVNNSPYFILGRFNYDHAVWAYDWLYLDISGKLWNEIKVNDFFISDQIGYLVWPTKEQILPKSELKKNYVIGKIKYLSSSKNLFIVSTKTSDQSVKKGLWNADSKTWVIEPQYAAIELLNVEKSIFALQKEENGMFILYNNKTKQQIGSNSYDYISYSGFVRKTVADEKQIYFYIDIATGKEYKDEYE